MKLSYIFCLSFACCSVLQAEPPAKPEPKEKAKEKKPYRPYDYVLTTSKYIEHYENILKKKPKSLQSLLMTAQLYMRRAKENDDQGDYDHAEQRLKKALSIDPKSLIAQYVQARLLAARHEFTKSHALAEKLYKEDPKRYGCLLLMADAQLELGNIEEAEKLYKEIAEKSPRTHLDSRRAHLASVKGNPEEAIKWMKKAQVSEGALAVTKELRAWYPTRLGEMYFEIGKLADAEKALKDAITLHPKYPIALGLMAKVLAAQDKRGEAVEMYKKAIAVNEDLPLLAGLGDLYTLMGKDDLAKQYYVRAEKAGEKDLAHAHELSLFLCNTNQKLDKALKIAQDEVAKRPNVHALDGLAWALYKKGKFQEAGKIIDKALATGMKEAELFYHAGMIFLKLEKKDKAKLYLEKALEMNPHFALIQSRDAKEKLKNIEQ